MTKRSVRKTFYFLVMTALFASCQKVIQVDLNSKDPQIVIEAEVTDDTTSPQTVKITKSVNISDGEAFPTVSGASVTLNDNFGNNVTLAETSPGLYQNSTLHGVPDRTYYLTINVDGKAYTSICTMPQSVPLDSVIVNHSSGGGPGGPGGGPGNGNSDRVESLTPVFQDPVGRGNYYKFKLQKDNTTSTSLFLFSDEVVDGGVNNRSLRDGDIRLNKEDTVKVIMMCIDKAVYEYFYGIRANGNGPNASATPANPVSNITGGALGYFSAYSVRTKSIKIQ